MRVFKYAINLDALNEKWKPFEDYMPKVAEIARRLPYAEAVELIEVSFDQSTGTEPVFFAQVRRSNQLRKNVYYTLSAIKEEYTAIADDKI